MPEKKSTVSIYNVNPSQTCRLSHASHTCLWWNCTFPHLTQEVRAKAPCSWSRNWAKLLLTRVTSLTRKLALLHAGLKSVQTARIQQHNLCSFVVSVSIHTSIYKYALHLWVNSYLKQKREGGRGQRIDGDIYYREQIDMPMFWGGSWCKYSQGWKEIGRTENKVTLQGFLWT